MVMKKGAMLIGWLFLWGQCESVAQYEDSPMKGVRYAHVSGGLNTSDFRSWNTSLYAHQRGESALVSQRLSFSQEYISAPNDSILSKKNRQLELAFMVGEGWKGKRKDWWVATGVGMSLIARMYADFQPQSPTEIDYLTKFTMGAAGFAEAGWMVQKNWGIVLNAYGNWNFRQPYWGANIGVAYRPKMTVSSKE
jgi:hypothetical protein